jgi:hypothetical protein
MTPDLAGTPTSAGQAEGVSQVGSGGLLAKV